MLIADLIHSCSNDRVAQAAVSCIGGPFAEKVRTAALENGVSVGRFVAIVVHDFALRADDGMRSSLARKISRTDQPILDGLRHLVETALEGGEVFFDDGIGQPGPRFTRRGRLSCDGLDRLCRARLQAF